VPHDDRPHVVMQMSASIDGRIAFGPALTMFDEHPANDALPSEDALWTRVTDAIRRQWSPRATMMGSGTVQREGAPWRELASFAGDASSLYADYLPEEVVSRTSHWSILVDGRGRCRSGYKATEQPGGHILHLVSSSASPEYLAFLRDERIPYLVGGQAHADLEGALRKLYALLGVRAMCLWGGGSLNGAMLRAGLVDEVHLILKPALIGGRQTPTLADCDDLTAEEVPTVLRLVSARPQEHGFLWLHYEVTRPVERAPDGPAVAT
jgi:2,5-diamino-6-(ribosylamino)-4(3H)-pyrimidinone 5'-phosphate reductase